MTPVRSAPLLAVVASSLASCGPSARDIDFSAWFGPQDSSGDVQSSRLELYGVHVIVVDGANVRIEESRNPTITCVHGAIVEQTPVPRTGRLYVYAKLKLNAEKGWHINQCAVRVRSGALKGAIITICDWTSQLIRDSYQACYELPEGARVEEGALDVEVVRFWGK